MGRSIAGYMVPDSLDELTQLQGRASQLKGDFEAHVRRIRADVSLSPEGKRTLIARAWMPFKSQMDSLQSADGAAFEAAKRTLRQQLIGLRDPSDTQARHWFQDAVQKAEAIPHAGLDEPSRAAQRAAVESLFRTADLVGDPVLARAALGVALDRGLREVVEEYKQRYPQDRAQVDDYQQLTQFDPTVSMNASYLWQVKRPQEIATYDMSDDRIASVAAESAAAATSHDIAPKGPAAEVPSWLTERGQASARARMAGAPRIEV